MFGEYQIAEGGGACRFCILWLGIILENTREKFACNLQIKGNQDGGGGRGFRTQIED